MPATVTAIPLEEQICFALYSASRSLTSLYRELLAPLGLTYPQYLVMVALWESGTTSVGDLGKRLFLDSGTLSPLLHRLEKGGFVTKRRSPDDERVVEISLTPSGDALQSESGMIGQRICSATGFAPEQLAELQQQIVSLAAHVRAPD